MPRPQTAHQSPHAAKRRKSISAKIVLFLFLGGAAAVPIYAYSVGMARVQRDIDRAIDLRSAIRDPRRKSEPSRHRNGKSVKPTRSLGWSGDSSIPRKPRTIGLLVVRSSRRSTRSSWSCRVAPPTIPTR